MSRGTRFRAELRIVGPATMSAPLVVGVALLGSLIALHCVPGTHVIRLFVSWLVLTAALPLLSGFLTATLGQREVVGELPFAWPVAYGRLLRYRWLLVVGSGTVAVSAAFGGAAWWGDWPSVTPFAASPLALLAGWLTTLVPLWGAAALGWSLAVWLHSASASRAMLALVGLGGLVASAAGGTLRGWLVLQGSWLALGSIALVLGWWRIHQGAWALAQGEEHT